MKKIALTAFSALFMGVAFNSALAQQPFHNYSDNFTITSATINAITPKGNVKVSQTGSSSFVISELNSKIDDDGDVFVTVGNKRGYCNLDIQDGAYDMNPTIKTVNCPGGLSYQGIEHDRGTYSYTLKFK